MDAKYLFYFFSGGLVVSVATYFASHSRGLLGAFIANLPTITLLTFLTINAESGHRAVVSYAQGLVIMLLPWLLYIFSVIFLTPRLGIRASLLAGLSCYLLFALLIINMKRY